METKCMSCGRVFSFNEDCFETDDGDLCPECTAEMRAEETQEIQYQKDGLA